MNSIGKGVCVTVLSMLVSFAFGQPEQMAPMVYAWMKSRVHSATETLAVRIAPPAGFERKPVPNGSFAQWLRNLPLKTGRPDVHLYDGRPKANQGVHAAVVDIDTGNKDLQQCADAVIRLRAEYLYSRGEMTRLHFNFTSGDAAYFARWSEGFRPAVQGNRVTWQKSASPDDSYRSFRTYLNMVFVYAGTASLERELQKVHDTRDVRAGDVFIQPGYPGHAVLVVDVAEDSHTGRRVFLLAQSYMPAQDIHILRNPAGGPLGAWYDSDFGPTLKTPEWTFAAGHLRRFEESR
jgi:hypothetical protein